MYCKNQEAQNRADAWRMKVDAMTQKDRDQMVEERGSTLSDEELEKIDRRLNSSTGQLIASIGARVPRINYRSGGKLIKPRPWKTSEDCFWKGQDSHLAVIVDEIIEKYKIKRHTA